MTAKAFSHIQKVSIVMACARETTEFVGSGEKANSKKPGVKFEVIERDVVAAWDIVQQSILVYKSFKVMHLDLMIEHLLSWC